MKAKTLTTCLLLALLLSFTLAACDGDEPPYPVPGSGEVTLPEEKPNIFMLDMPAYITVVFDTPEYEVPPSWENAGWTYDETPLQHYELVKVCELHPLFGTVTNTIGILDSEKCSPLLSDVRSLLVWTDEDGERQVIYFK